MCVWSQFLHILLLPFLSASPFLLFNTGTRLPISLSTLFSTINRRTLHWWQISLVCLVLRTFSFLLTMTETLRIERHEMMDGNVVLPVPTINILLVHFVPRQVTKPEWKDRTTMEPGILVHLRSDILKSTLGKQTGSASHDSALSHDKGRIVKKEWNTSNGNTTKPKHPCERCGRLFGRKSDGMKHFPEVHERAKDYACSVSGRQFARKDYCTVRSHVQYVT